MQCDGDNIMKFLLTDVAKIVINYLLVDKDKIELFDWKRTDYIFIKFENFSPEEFFLTATPTISFFTTSFPKTEKYSNNNNKEDIKNNKYFTNFFV